VVTSYTARRHARHLPGHVAQRRVLARHKVERSVLPTESNRMAQRQWMVCHRQLWHTMCAHERVHASVLPCSRATYVRACRVVSAHVCKLNQLQSRFSHQYRQPLWATRTSLLTVADGTDALAAHMRQSLRLVHGMATAVGAHFGCHFQERLLLLLRPQVLGRRVVRLGVPRHLHLHSDDNPNANQCTAK
jgi:hypothetical protein